MRNSSKNMNRNNQGPGPVERRHNSPRYDDNIYGGVNNRYNQTFNYDPSR